jgi:hypothetical protein
MAYSDMVLLFYNDRKEKLRATTTATTTTNLNCKKNCFKKIYSFTVISFTIT